MALHTDLPIHRTGVQLLELAVKAQQQMPRGRIGPPPTGFAGPLKGAPLAARQSRIREGRLIGSLCALATTSLARRARAERSAP